MKTIRRLKALMMVVVLVLSILAVPGGNMQMVEAAPKKVTVKKVQSVDSLTGSKTIYLAKGKKAKLKTTVTVTPNKAANKKVTYKSSNRKVATVTDKGVITGKKAGTAKITVTSKKNKKKKTTVKVKVVKGKVTSVKLNTTSETITVGDSLKLTAKVKVSAGGKKNVIWSSSNEKVATVTNKGNVKAVAAGKATITVKATDGSGKKATCKVTVEDEPAANSRESDIAILKEIIEEQNELGADVPTDMNDEAYTWDKISGRLTGISWFDCGLQETLSLEGLSALEVLVCGHNELSELDVCENTALAYLSCYGNQLSELDVCDNTALLYLFCDGNQLSDLDVSDNTALIQLTCNENELSDLDVSNNTALETLRCYNNQLTELDVSKNIALKWLWCHNNQLTELDVSKNIALEMLWCYDNQLTDLDVSSNTVLTDLRCDDNVIVKKKDTTPEPQFNLPTTPFFLH